MFAIFHFQNLVVTIATLVMFAVQAWAFVDAVVRRPEAFVAADKLTKPAWLIILGVTLAAHMLFWSPVSLLNLVGIVAAIVYLVDVRRRVIEVSRGSRW